ncbi:MAG: tRNA 2-selenouridine(34) synthase MnmH [Gammaproteobacteria bacterium]
MSARPDAVDFRALFLAGAPLLDVRAPVEFAEGSFPGAENIPLLTDDERAQVGTTYKRSGQQAAIELGHRLVNGAVKRERIARWRDFAQRHPDGYLYCFRGGLRSQTVRQWLHEAGVDYPLVVGGYKALRRFLLDETERMAASLPLAIVGGRTGSGKTRVIHAIRKPAVDLEGLANHRGSSFGRLPGGQPTQIDFENALAIALLRAEAELQRAGGTAAPLWLEDESRLIGRCAIPLNIRPRMEAAPLVLVEEPLESRVQVALEDYVLDSATLYLKLHGEDGFELYAGALRSSLDRVQKRLGGLMHRKAADIMNAALAEQRAGRGIEAHRGWIALLLTHYYDPMYDWQLTQKRGELLFRGNRNEVIDWIDNRAG